MNLFEHQQITIEGIGELNTDPDLIDTRPTAYAPASLTRSQPTGMDDPEPARFTVPISVPFGFDGRILRENLVQNPSFELDLFAVDGSPDTTRDRVTADGFWWVGSAALRVRVGSTPDALTYVSQPIEVVPGEYVGARFMVRSSGGTYRYRARTMFYDASSALIGTSEWPAYVTGPNATWAQVRAVPTQVPAQATSAEVRLYVATTTTDTAPPDAMFTTDGWMATHGATPGEVTDQLDGGYFDGSSPDTPTAISYWWNEDPHRSASVEISPDLAPLVSDEVNVWVGPRDYPQQVNSTFRGWIESMTRETRTMRRRDGSTFVVWWFEITATDALGYLSRLRVGDTPWPQEPVQDRWDRIVALLPSGMVEADSRADQTNVMCAARDVDSVPALQLLRDTIALVDGVVIDLGGFGVVGQPRDSYAFHPDDDSALLNLPAAAFERGQDVLDYDLSVNVARVTGKQIVDGEVSDAVATFQNEFYRDWFGESAYAISGDGMAPTGGTIADTAIGVRLERLVTMAGWPQWRIDGPVTAVPEVLAPLLFAGDADGADLNTLMVEGLGRCVRFDGAPSGRDLFRVIGVQFTYGGARHESLTLEVEPWQMAAPAEPDPEP